MGKILQGLGSHARTSTLSKPPKLSAAELAKSSWALSIESYATVPEVYSSFFDPLLAAGEPFPYTVLTPSHERFIHRQAEKLICVLDREIAVLERSGNTFEARCYPIDGISYLEFRTALLASSFKICGRLRDGSYSAATLLFNSVTDYLFTPIMKQARPVKTEPANACQSWEPEPFDDLIKVNFKFMNYARHSLLEGERLVHSVFQPEIRTSMLAALGRTFYKTVSPTHMTILTDRELILIREESVRRKEDKYGGIWTYVPINKVASLFIGENSRDLLVLAVRLTDDSSFEFLFGSAAEKELQQLVERFWESVNR